MAQFFTNFDEYPVGDVTTSGQTDWTPRITNGGADYRIIDGGDQDGKFLRVQAVRTNGSRVLGYNPLDGVSDNLETLVKFWIFKSGSDGSTGRYGASYTRYGGNSEASTIGYSVGFLPVSSVKSLVLNEDSTGVVQFANYAWAMSTDYFVRTRISGTLRQIKIWPASSAEPGTWTLQSNGTPPTIASPYSGVGTYQGDSYLYVKQFSAGTGGDSAPMYGTKTLDYAANAFIEWQLNLSYAANANIERVESLSYTANANIERVESLSYTANATIDSFYFTASVDYTANARIEKTSVLDYTANAFIEKQLNIGYNSNAFIEWQLSSSYTANAFIEYVRSQNYLANARIERQNEQVSYAANARVERIEGLSYSANANISNPSPEKKPQTWEDSETHQPQNWSADDKQAATWNEANEKLPAAWQDSENSQPQQWSEDDNKKPADWSPLFYD